MAKFSVKITKDLLNEFKGLQKQLNQVLTDELYAAAVDVETQSKALVPVDTGVLKNSSGIDVDGLKFTVYYGAKYAAYVEYGTVTKVYVPEEMSDNASQFKGSGNANNSGIRARPFLYPAYKIVTRDLIPKIDKSLQTELLHIK